MAVGPKYLLDKPPGPSRPKLFLDQQVVPFAVNVAGALEVALDRVAVRSKIRPSILLAGLAGLSAYLVVRSLRSRPQPGQA